MHATERCSQSLVHVKNCKTELHLLDMKKRCTQEDLHVKNCKIELLLSECKKEPIACSPMYSEELQNIATTACRYKQMTQR